MAIAPRPLGRLVVVMMTFLWVGPVVADSELSQRHAELEQLQRRLEAVEAVVARLEGERSAAAAALVEAERALSRASRRLRDTTHELAATEAALREGEREAVLLDARIAERQDELAQWLRHQYLHGGSTMVPMIAMRDPNQLARDRRYLAYLGQARSEMIAALRNDLDAQRQLHAALTTETDRLAMLLAEQRTHQAEIDRSRSQRARALEQAAEQLQAQQREVAALRASEEELTEVIEALAAAAATRELARQRQAAALAAQAERSTAPVRVVAGREPTPGETRDLAGPTPTGVRFAQLRGQIGFPVRGELTGRFGAPRSSVSVRWRGVFIRASAGEQVVAVAPGQVVFSDWLRGYGNLLIIEHDDDYLTIYGNNDTLLRVVGEHVPAGAPIASVGAGGVGQDSGLYFEIRHKGQPVDPMQWMRAR